MHNNYTVCVKSKPNSAQQCLFYVFKVIIIVIVIVAEIAVISQAELLRCGWWKSDQVQKRDMYSPFLLVNKINLNVSCNQEYKLKVYYGLDWRNLKTVLKSPIKCYW